MYDDMYDDDTMRFTCTLCLGHQPLRTPRYQPSLRLVSKGYEKIRHKRYEKIRHERYDTFDTREEMRITTHAAPCTDSKGYQPQKIHAKRYA